MKRLLFCSFLIASLSACSHKEAGMSPDSAPAAKMAASGASLQKQYLAYQHTIRIDTDEQKVTLIFNAGQAACLAAVSEHCVILASELSTGRSSSAYLKIRATAAGIQKLITALSTQGPITSQATTAEDLAGSIEDAVKKLAMLTSYRHQLEELQAKPGSNIDTLIKLNKELAEVQSEIEAMTGKQAQLMQRVETETLSVYIDSAHRSGFWTPIKQALSEFTGNLSQAMSALITFIAFMLPWSVLLALLLWIVRKIWRRWKAPKTLKVKNK
ncbi:DUF4349 domain-containing protein [Solimicrobium silvestre]|uniref:DUF4349 domain-containing protein n=1 Tax=Solimicrobium silvestre TaxID=2099400 RepID=A0A2S9H023_9BURK|nr:DUF4349 domain-containing protein [Solimicrobium silvestre]PRC93298.1 hypothetical protein S2091_2036 [Solimicrobium silvestre]